MKWLSAALTLLVPVTIYAIHRLTREIEQAPQPQVPKYRYTTDRHYDYETARRAARRARTRTATGRALPPPREELIH